MEWIVVGSAPRRELKKTTEPKTEADEKKTAEVFARQIVRHLGPPPPGVRLTVERVGDEQQKACCVVCYYDETSRAAADYAWRCERRQPARWDQIARDEIGQGS